MAVAPKTQRHVRVNEATHRILQELSDEFGVPMSTIIERAVERERRESIFMRAEQQLRAIEADPASLAELEAEYRLWDGTAADGLDPEDWS